MKKLAMTGDLSELTAVSSINSWNWPLKLNYEAIRDVKEGPHDILLKMLM
jgi:hypothetical protein